MTAAMVAQMLIGAIEIAKISATLVSENREPTEEEIQTVRNHVRRANDLWEAAG